MKVIIVSDTHRDNVNYFKVVKMHQPDMVIHCGDAEGSEYALTSGVECPVHIVLGNNDYASELPRELELEIAGFKVWVTHGHRYSVYAGPERIMEEAKARGKDVVFYGHTHHPAVDRGESVIAVNPGSISYPRQEGRRPSFAIMEDDRFGDFHFTIGYL